MNATSDSDPYGGGSAEKYDQHHRNRLRTRMTTRREIGVLRKALKIAGRCPTALDLPCGTGRFWPAFADAGVGDLIAADVSQGMLDVAQANRLSSTIPSRLECMSAFNIELPDNAVTFIACMRFLHHLSLATDREQVLSELRRVSSNFVAISLWVDGNLGARRRMRKTPPAPAQGFGRRICRPTAEVEREFQNAGFRIVQHFDVWPKLSMWRLYLLQISDG
jgi:SAM-dependent methyltransferase